MGDQFKVWSNGRLVSPEETKVSLLSHGFSRGSAIFDVFCTYSGPEGLLAFRMDAHLDRLINSAKLLGMDLPYSREELMSACAETARANNFGRGLVKIFAYWGGEKAVALVPDEPLDLAIYCIPESPELGFDDYSPISACLARWQKLDPSSVPTAAKSCANYLNGYLARKDAVDRGFDLGIMVDKNNMLAEGSIEAVFIVKNGVLKVPPLGQVLKSISRDSIVQAVPHARIPVEVAPITKEELFDADEIFASHSMSRVMPVKRFEERELDAPGPVTTEVINLMEDILHYKVEEFMPWFQPLT